MFRRALILLLLTAVPATAADKWTEAKTKNFVLVGNASPNQMREVGESLELFRWGFLQFFRIPQWPSSVATIVVVFKDDNSFKPHKPLYNGKPANIAGYFQSGVDLNFIALTGDRDTPRVVYHEMVHRLMADNFGSLPLWFQEGFAEAFGSLEVEGNGRKIRIGLPISEHVALLNERRFMPLDRLFSVVHGSAEYNEEEKQGLFYAQSWALVHYLMLGDGGKHRPQFMQFLAELPKSRGSQTDLFQQVFKTTLPNFQRAFEQYVQQLALPALQIDSPPGFERNIEMTTRTMSEAEGEFFLGDMHLHSNNMALAETHLQKAVQLDAKHGGAQAALGRVRMRQGNQAAAAEHFTRAVTLDDKNYLVHYYYADFLRSRADERETMRSQLKQTLALAPHFREATQMLAFANVSANVDIPETAAMLTAALKNSPGNENLIVLLAMTLVRSANREEARPLAQHILASPTATPAMKSNAQTVLQILDRSAAAEKSTNTRLAPRIEAPATSTRAADETRTEISRPPSVEPQPTATDVPVRLTRSRPAGTSVIRGLLTLLDCTKGVTLSVTVDGKTVRLFTAQPDRLEFTSYSPDVAGSIACGPVPQRPVSVTYYPRVFDDSIGEPIAIDFEAPAEVKP
jgi:Tfp pilus assembly protein PilF